MLPPTSIWFFSKNRWPALRLGIQLSIRVLKAGCIGYQNCSKCEPRMMLFHWPLIVSNMQGYKWNQQLPTRHLKWFTMPRKGYKRAPGRSVGMPEAWQPRISIAASQLRRPKSWLLPEMGLRLKGLEIWCACIKNCTILVIGATLTCQSSCQDLQGWG